MKRFTMFSLTMALVLVMGIQLQAQSQTTQSEFNGIGLYSIGLNFGSYSPGMDYFDRTQWDFPSSLMVQGEADIDLIAFARLRVGAGYGVTSSTVFRGEPYGRNEIMTYTFMPLSLSLLPHVKFGMVNVYGGGGFDLMNIGVRYESRSYDTKENGATLMPHALLGAQIGIAPRAMLSLQGRYLIGEFDQQLRAGENEPMFTETIKMNGLHFSVGVRFKL